MSDCASMLGSQPEDSQQTQCNSALTFARLELGIYRTQHCVGVLMPSNSTAAEASVPKCCLSSRSLLLESPHVAQGLPCSGSTDGCPGSPYCTTFTAPETNSQGSRKVDTCLEKLRRMSENLPAGLLLNGMWLHVSTADAGCGICKIGVRMNQGPLCINSVLLPQNEAI